jgi:hypothetical protein
MATETKADDRTVIGLTSAEIDRPPNYLYRYRATGEHLRQILVGNSLYCSSPKHFNDALDCRIPTELSGMPDDVRSYCDGLITERWPSMPADERNRRVDRFVSEGRWENTARDVQPIVDNCGVLCLSERWDISCMWKRYAQDHTGVCLEFLAADEKELTGFGSLFFKVTYSDRIEFSLLADPWEQAKRILLTKSTAWSYEQEWRFILPAPFGASTVGNLPFLPEFLTGVIFGYKVDDATRERVKGWLAEGKCQPALYQAEGDGSSLIKKRIE